METLLLAVFDEEKQAHEGAQLLWDLDGAGALSLFGVAVIARDLQGKLSLMEYMDRDRHGTAEPGLLVKSLATLLRSPSESAAIPGANLLGGAVDDLTRVGIGAEVVGEVAANLPVGKFAVVVEMAENGTKPVDARLQALGGVVLRLTREEIIHARLRQEAAEFRTALADLADERARGAKEAHAALDARREVLEDRVRATQERIKVTLTAEAEEAAMRLRHLRGRLARIKGGKRARLEARIAELQAELSRRSELLREAWSLTKKALGR